MIGRKLVLWREEYRSNAYTDQAGVSQGGYVVLEQIPVTITETRKVPGMWGGPEKKYEGWKAIADHTGEEFTCNWFSFPDDSMTPAYYWDARTDSRGTWQPVDACQAFNHGYAHVNEDGTRCNPIGATICSKHINGKSIRQRPYAYMDDGEDFCFPCHIAELEAKRGNK